MSNLKESKNALSWGILFHALGLFNTSRKFLEDVTTNINTEYPDLAKKVQEWHDESLKNWPDITKEECLEQLAQLTSDIIKPLHQRYEAPITLPKTKRSKIGLSKLLESKGIKTFTIISLPEIWKECDVTKPSENESYIPKKDSYQNGFSRNPFTPIENNDIRNDIALAIVCYILRGHARFYSQPSGKRDFNNAKLALNDFHQAFQLSWRLYQSLPWNHQHLENSGFVEYFKNVIKFNLPDLDSLNSIVPGTSPYFIWQALSLCDIMRGNIYRQIDYYKESDRHYRHALDRFKDIQSYSSATKDLRDILSTNWAYLFATPTLIKTMLERSKVLFDLGQFLESLVIQVSCLRYLICIGPIRKEEGNPKDKTKLQLDLQDSKNIIHSDKKRDKLLAKITDIIAFLDAERKMPIFSRLKISAHFGDPIIDKGQLPKNSLSKEDLTRLCRYIPPDLGSLLVKIMSRIGFTLYTLRARTKPDILTRNKINWLKQYFRFDKIIWQKVFSNNEVPVRPSHLGRYCEAIILNKKPSKAEKEIFENELDRKFSLQMIETLQQDRIRKHKDPDIVFYRKILRSTTENIGNLITIPQRNQKVLMRQGYKNRRVEGDLSKGTKSFDIGDLNKFVVLRRWQSTNPKLPRPRGQQLRGGGYYLLWYGKGIVIDPGFDFIQNFYDEGFSMADIDAVIITHTHPDHDDDLLNITTLIREWNQFHYEIGDKKNTKDLDFLLNDSAHQKFSSWLQASGVKIGRVMSLPLTRWDKDSKSSTDSTYRGRNITIPLYEQSKEKKPKPSDRTYWSGKYSLNIEVIPAWHDDVIGKTSAVGLKFHLLNNEGKPDGIIGITSDTGAYGLSVQKHPVAGEHKSITCQYSDCDILVAHLGDIRLREIATVMESGNAPWYDVKDISTHPLICLFNEWFPVSIKGDAFRRRVQEFLHFIITLNLAPSAALKVKLTLGNKCEYRLQEWLGYFISKGKTSDDFSYPDANDFCELYQKVKSSILAELSEPSARFEEQLEIKLRAAENEAIYLKVGSEEYFARRLLHFLVCCSILPNQYKYHLGIFGIYKLFQSMLNHDSKIITHNNKLFIVGELPEELASYRQNIAYFLDMSNSPDSGKKLYPFTGDIGLHLNFGHKKPAEESQGEEGFVFKPAIRCAFCNYNNEIVNKPSEDNKPSGSYHDPEEIHEFSLKRYGAAMIYLCRGHYPGNWDTPEYFLSHPYLRVI